MTPTCCHGMASAGEQPRRRPARLLFVCTLLLLGAVGLSACAHAPAPTAQHAKRNILASIHVDATLHANHDTATALDIVFVRDAAADAQIPDNAGTWFADKSRFIHALGTSVEVVSLQIPPATTIAAVALPRDHAQAVAVYAFADYPDASARQRLDLGTYRHGSILLDTRSVHVVAPGQGAGMKPPASRYPADAARLRQAEQRIASGDAAGALHGPLAQVLAHYPAQPVEGGNCYFSVTTSLEAGMYGTLCTDHLEHTVMLSGDWARALILEGRAYNALQQHDAARDALQEAHRLAPYNPYASLELGDTYAMQDNWPQALQSYREAAGTADFFDGKDGIALKLRATRDWGRALQQQGDLDTAEVVYRRALKLSPGDALSMKALQDIERLRKLRDKRH